MTDDWKAELRLLKDVVDAWEAHERLYPANVSGNVVDRFRQRYTPQLTATSWSSQVDSFIAHHDDSANSPKDFPVMGYMHAKPVSVGSPVLYPLVLFFLRLRGDELEVVVRVATFFSDKNEYGAVDVHGWRFDMADPLTKLGPKTHTYPHVQRITSWRPSDTDFYPEEKPGPNTTGSQMAGPSINGSRPAFPLPSTTPAGVVISAMTSLYGPVVTSQILESVKLKTVLFRQEMQRVMRI